MNIRIRTNGMSGRELSTLSNQIYLNTGYTYGYLTIDRQDTTTISFELTFCSRHRKRLLKADRGLVMGFVKGFILGSGVSIYNIEWI